jgi:hypothetical protein
MSLERLDRDDTHPLTELNIECGEAEAGLMGGSAWRFGTGQLQHLARLVGQEMIDSFLAISRLPALDCGVADASSARDFPDRQSLEGKGTIFVR